MRGIAVTRRFTSTSLTIVSGHEDPTKSEPAVDWDAVARLGGTLVILMGVAAAPSIAARLLAAGRGPDTPVAAVRWGTRPTQHTLHTTLGRLAEAPLAAPSVLVVGEVAADPVDWFTTRPLFGRRVVITRAPSQASRLSDRLTELGAEVLGVPTIAIVDAPDGGAGLAGALEGIGAYSWVVLGSVNAAQRFLDAVGDLRRLGDLRLTVVGPGTAEVLRAARLVPDLVPQRYVAEGLLDEFPTAPEGGARVLVPRSARARPVLVEGLRSAGWAVDDPGVYDTLPAEIGSDSMTSIASADAVAFASSSAATAFCAAVPRDRRPPTAVAIGPITAASADGAFDRVVQADPHDLDGLVAALVRSLSPPPSG
ncbi:MAG: uroporphyrinogen-III synthase [Microthrixaceae bacterium]